MTTATGHQSIVAEFEFPSGAFSKMLIRFKRGWGDSSGLKPQNPQYGEIWSGVIEIGNPDGVLHDNVASLVETALMKLSEIGTAEVTITGEKWRIEMTEATDGTHVGLVPWYFRITNVTVGKWGRDDRYAFDSLMDVNVGVRQQRSIDGDDNDNELTGGPRNDVLNGGAGNDWLFGGAGDDRLYGGAGDDELNGGAGKDRLDGGAEDDELNGGAGDDWLEGGEGDDTLHGGEGDDYLDGGPGEDSLDGGEGDDIISTGAGDDELNGGAGRDHLYGGEGDDTLYGGAGRDRMGGSAGDDTLHGGEGDDLMGGGAGDDTLYGGEGDDDLHGSEGDDTLSGGAGNDKLEGFTGDDTLIGGAGADRLTGRAGTDIFRFNRGDSLGSGDVITDFTVAGANRDALDLANFNIDYTRDLESQRLTLSGLMDADGDGATDDRKITLPDGGAITLLNLGSAALAIDDFTFVGDDGALTNVDAGDDPEEDQPDTESDGDDGALTNVDAGDDPDKLTPPGGDGADPPPPAVTGSGGALQQHIALANTPPDDGGRSRLQELVTSGDATGRLDAGALSISGGVNLPASDDGAHRSSYHLYYDADGGSYFLRFDDDRTADLPISATAAQVDAALEGLNGISSAEVTGEPGDFTIALIADEPHVLQWSDVNLGGDGGLDYLM